MDAVEGFFIVNGASGIMLASIILIFLEHNASVSEDCERCMQILPATRSRMYKVDKS